MNKDTETLDETKDTETLNEIKDTLNRMENLLNKATTIIEKNNNRPQSVQVVNTVKTKNIR